VTKVLFVVTAADRWTLKKGEIHPSGYWAEEFAVPHRLFTEAGWEVTVATPGGRAPTRDELSLGISGGAPSKRRDIRTYLDSIAPVLQHPTSLDTVDAEAYDVVFYPGGHGPMEDLAHDATSGALLRGRLRSGRPLALLCHGPAAILAATEPDGSSAFKGYRMTALSNVEERLNLFAWRAQWLLEDKLKEVGVDYAKGRLPLRPYVVVDRNLYTGQNPMSSEDLARRLIADVSAQVR